MFNDMQYSYLEAEFPGGCSNIISQTHSIGNWLFRPAILHSLNKHLLSTCDVSGTVLTCGLRKSGWCCENRIKAPRSWGFHCSWGEPTINNT